MRVYEIQFFVREDVLKSSTFRNSLFFPLKLPRCFIQITVLTLWRLNYVFSYFTESKVSNIDECQILYWFFGVVTDSKVSRILNTQISPSEHRLIKSCVLHCSNLTRLTTNLITIKIYRHTTKIPSNRNGDETKS